MDGVERGILAGDSARHHLKEAGGSWWRYCLAFVVGALGTLAVMSISTFGPHWQGVPRQLYTFIVQFLSQPCKSQCGRQPPRLP